MIKDGIHSNNYAPIPSDTKESILTKLSPKQLKQIFELTLDSLDRALNFIDANELIYIIDRIDYILYLTGYFAYNKNLDIKKERSLVEWVKDVDFVNMSNTMRREEFSKIISI